MDCSEVNASRCGKFNFTEKGAICTFEKVFFYSKHLNTAGLGTKEG